jgi:hypothetical protein
MASSQMFTRARSRCLHAGAIALTTMAVLGGACYGFAEANAAAPRAVMSTAVGVKLHKIEITLPTGAGGYLPVPCPASYTVISGGYEVDNPAIMILGSAPGNSHGLGGYPFNAWVVDAYNSDSSTHSLTVWAECMRIR